MHQKITQIKNVGAEDFLFVCHKIDSVDAAQRQHKIEEITKKLETCYIPNFDKKDSVVEFSTKKAVAYRYIPSTYKRISIYAHPSHTSSFTQAPQVFIPVKF